MDFVRFRKSQCLSQLGRKGCWGYCGVNPWSGNGLCHEQHFVSSGDSEEGREGGETQEGKGSRGSWMKPGSDVSLPFPVSLGSCSTWILTVIPISPTDAQTIRHGKVSFSQFSWSSEESRATWLLNSGPVFLELTFTPADGTRFLLNLRLLAFVFSFQSSSSLVAPDWNETPFLLSPPPANRDHSIVLTLPAKEQGSYKSILLPWLL